MEEEIKKALGIEDVYLFETVTSTNDIAKKLASNNRSALILANVQTKGRGRFGREWYSPEGGLWFSILFSPKNHRELSCLTLLSALSIREAIERITHLPSLIRWPNDVVYNNKKLAGVLSETSKQAIIIGMGVNVNQEEFPPSLPDATSLRIETRRVWDTKPLLLEILLAFRRYYEIFEGEGFETLRKDVKRYSSLLSKFVSIDFGEKRLTGTVIDIDEKGRLVFRSESGRLLTLSSGEVKEIR